MDLVAVNHEGHWASTVSFTGSPNLACQDNEVFHVIRMTAVRRLNTIAQHISHKSIDKVFAGSGRCWAISLFVFIL